MKKKLQEYDNTLIIYGCPLHLLNQLGQDVTPQAIINQINEVSTYFQNHITQVHYFLNFLIKVPLSLKHRV